MMAVKEGRIDIVSLLLEAGADTDIQKKVLQYCMHASNGGGKTPRPSPAISDLHMRIFMYIAFASVLQNPIFMYIAFVLVLQNP